MPSPTSIRRTVSRTPSPFLPPRPTVPSVKALGKRKRSEAHERDSETSSSPPKQSRLSAWRKHAGRYLLTPVLGPAKEVDEPPALPIGTSDYDASSEGSSQRSSASPLSTAAELPSTSSHPPQSGPFRFVGRRPPVCSPAPSCTNLSYQPFSPGPSGSVPPLGRVGRRPRPPSASPYAPSAAIFSPRTCPVPYTSMVGTTLAGRAVASPQTRPEPETRVTVLPALSVRVRNRELPLHISLGTLSGRSRLFGSASPAPSYTRPPRRSRILPAGTAEPCSSLGSGTIVFFNEMHEIRAYRVAQDIHKYTEKFVRTRPAPPSPGIHTPMLRPVPLHEPVRCMTPQPLRCATPEPLDIFYECHSPQPSLSGDSAATLCTYSPQLSTSLTLVNDSDDAFF